MGTLFQKEPVAVVTIANVIVTIAAAYGLHLTTDQIIGTLSVLSAIAALIARSRVTPVPPSNAPSATPPYLGV